MFPDDTIVIKEMLSNGQLLHRDLGKMQQQSDNWLIDYGRILKMGRVYTDQKLIIILGETNYNYRTVKEM